MNIFGRSVVSILVIAAIVGPPTVGAQTTNLTPVGDTTLFENNPDNNLGSQITMVAGTTQGGKRSRALVRFDVAGAVPAGATVTSAALLLTAGSVGLSRGDGLDFGLHRILKSWGEGAGSGQSAGLGSAAATGETTWNARFYPNPLWSAAGGQTGSDFAIAASAISAMAAPTLEFSSPEMAADVLLWLSSPGTNFGWMIRIADEDPVQTGSHLATREDPDNAPVLTIEYEVAAPPAPATPPTLFNAARIGGNFRFSFSGESNRTYVVEFRDSLTTSNWNVLENFPAQPVATTWHFTNAASVPARYFRVRTP